MEERKKMFYLYKSNLFDALFYIISSFLPKIRKQSQWQSQLQ